MSKNYGVLLPISSLPGNHGVGDFGENAFRFIDWLAKNKFKYWQILPLNPVGPGYSPYMSSCSNAIDFRYISLDLVRKEGFLDRVSPYFKDSDRVNYQNVANFKKKYLWFAYKNFICEHKKELLDFKNNNTWVYQYALYETFKAHNDNQCWNLWPTKYRDYFNNEFSLNEYESEIYFIIYLQYEALKQWNSLHKYAKKRGIKIICDMPFYVGFDGVECWTNRDQFSIDENNNLYEVGGVGPDAFSSEGQLWGTPIYHFKKMKENNYKLLVDRIGYLLSLCDVLRIDHFRAFDTYYVIPANETSAINGEWKLGPSDDFFKQLYKKYSNANLIAEDLGELRKEVLELRDRLKLPGMHVFEFTVFDDKNKSNNNMIVYSGTHDNETLLGWINNLSVNDLEKLKAIVHYKENDDLYSLVLNHIASLQSKITIFPVQDLLKLDNSCRMNTPGTMSEDNWTWKLKDLSVLDSAINFIRGKK